MNLTCYKNLSLHEKKKKLNLIKEIVVLLIKPRGRRESGLVMVLVGQQRVVDYGWQWQLATSGGGQ